MLINPKLSIVTINYNNRAGLKKTIESVLQQKFNDLEYIIIDGGSTDGSKELIELNCDKIAYYVSESDNGIYHAMNKGITAATGDYVLFLNSGDWFFNQDILLNFMKDLGDYDLIYGNKINYFSDDKIIVEKSPTVIDLYVLSFTYSLPHQATIIKRKLFSEIGLYDENLKIVSDWKFVLLALFKHNYTYLHKDIDLIYYDMAGISSTEKYNDLQIMERKSVIDAHFTNIKHMDKESLLIQNLKFYYKYSRTLRVLKILGLIKKFEF